MSESAIQHRSAADPSVACAVITVSDTRTLETDQGGEAVVDYLTKATHRVVSRQIVCDDADTIAKAIREASVDAQAVLLTGGTGISARDNTYETVTLLIDKPLPGYGELFRMLSYQEIGAASMLSRATGGVFARTLILTMPGSTAAVRLAMEQLILPELGHLVYEATK